MVFKILKNRNILRTRGYLSALKSNSVLMVFVVLETPITKLKSVGYRAFPSNGPRIWHPFPKQMWDIDKIVF